jgi:ketosteroid isomerase-like protein
MADSTEEIMRVAARFEEACTTANAEMFADVLADGATVWHNDDEVDMPKSVLTAYFNATQRPFKSFKWDDIWRVPIPGGYLEEHTMNCIHQSGHPLRVLCCLIVSVSGGKITRVKEYIDPAALRELERVSDFKYNRKSRVLALKEAESNA